MKMMQNTEEDEDSPDCHHDYYTIPEECIDEEMFYNFYEEIPDSPIGILRTPDLRLLSKDNDSMIPRPKLGWPIRKVTFGMSNKMQEEIDLISPNVFEGDVILCN